MVEGQRSSTSKADESEGEEERARPGLVCPLVTLYCYSLSRNSCVAFLFLIPLPHGNRRSVGAPVDEKEVSVSHNPHQNHGEIARINQLNRQLKKTSPKSADTTLKFTKHRCKWLTLCYLNLRHWMSRSSPSAAALLSRMRRRRTSRSPAIFLGLAVALMHRELRAAYL